MFRIHETEALCEYRRTFWAKKNFPIEWVDAATEEVQKSKLADVILINPMNSKELLKQSGRMSRESLLLGYFDHFVLREGRYWPESYGKRSFRELIVAKARTLDLKDWVYVTGSSPWARLAILTAFDVGFRKIRILSDNTESSAELVDDFKRFCFGLEITPLERSQLTLQPNNASLLINSESLLQDQELLVTLMYLNFIHRGGLIVDMEFQTNIGALCKEGEASGFQCLAGLHVRGSLDFEILENASLVKRAGRDSYLKEWQEFLLIQNPA